MRSKVPEYLKGELIELDADGNVKEGGIKNEDASMSVFHMKDEEAVNAFKGKKAGEEVKFNAVKAYPNKTDFAAMLGVTKEEAEHAGEKLLFYRQRNQTLYRCRSKRRIVY